MPEFVVTADSVVVRDYLVRARGFNDARAKVEADPNSPNITLIDIQELDETIRGVRKVPLPEVGD